MENRASTNDLNITKDLRNISGLYRGNVLLENSEINPVFQKLAKEGGETFYNYIYWLGLAKDLNLLVLPSSRHYFYNSEDLKEVKTIMNLKQLNRIKKTKDFLDSIFHIMPQKSYLIGCFSDNKNQNRFLFNSSGRQHKTEGDVDVFENGIASRFSFLNMMYNLIDARTYKFMTKSTVKLQLEDSGFKVLDMTEINSLTYFCAQKVRSSAS
jgi:hypothetical protein